MRTRTSTVSDGVLRLSANVRDILFEGIWPVSHGVAMNSYLVTGERTAIIDGVCGWDGVPETLISQLRELGIAPESVDYVVVNHMEPDHSGWLEAFRTLRGDDFTVVATERAIPLFDAFYGFTPRKIRTVADGDALDLGGGRQLRFLGTPNVHWPETMFTFDESSGTLFTCDAFGGFGALEDRRYDDELGEEEIAFFEAEALRYYANIVSTFSPAVLQAIKKTTTFGDSVKIVAPAHGLVWRRDPGRIIGDYGRWAGYQKGPAEAAVTVIWGSMYGNTERAVRAAVETLADTGLEVLEHRVPECHIGDILASAWRSSGVLLAMPTYEYKMFPPMAEALDELGRKRVQGRVALRLGSYGWSGGAQAELDEIMTRHRTGWSFLEPVEFKGRPKEEDIELVRRRVREFAEKVKTAAAG